MTDVTNQSGGSTQSGNVQGSGGSLSVNDSLDGMSQGTDGLPDNEASQNEKGDVFYPTNYRTVDMRKSRSQYYYDNDQVALTTEPGTGFICRRTIISCGWII